MVSMSHFAIFIIVLFTYKKDAVCAVCPPTGVIAIRINCNSYRLCINGISIVQNCPKGTFFDGKECSIETADNKCKFVPCEETVGIILQRNEEQKCQVYHICNNGIEIANRTCPEDMFFWNDTCLSRTPADKVPKVCGGTKVLKRAYSTVLGCPFEGISLIMTPGDCGKYSVCSEGVVIEEKTCPRGTHFNQELELCSTPAMADCPYA